MGKHQPTKKEKTKLRQVKDRVKALQASDLRTHVKSIVLRNWSSGNTDTTAWEVTEAIYSSIMRFTAVSTVVCQDLLMKSTHLQSVLSLPNLRRIESVRCLFPFDTIGHALEEVVVIAPWVPAIPQDQALASGITTFLTSGSLKILDLRAICAVPYLIPMLDGSSPFNRLTRIRLSLPSDRPWSIISPLLALCPVLEELMVERVAAITTTGSALSPASCLPVVHTGAADVEFYQFNRPMDSGIVVATELLQPHDTISNITLRNVFDYRLFSEADVS
ncbi:hypothetical protein PUNSTDRAFT_49037, partial [Punctularia strigosozonata HHB-11173 SS5]|uniref:uncharacterized protein n=1 Tax=Punctularia strigosozonata (strain HHB-11173) TaxID=741275 RepID=UPI00044164E0